MITINNKINMTMVKKENKISNNINLPNNNHLPLNKVNRINIKIINNLLRIKCIKNMNIT